jgi:3-oxoacyl-[acyl-carrier-protein] synthase II
LFAGNISLVHGVAGSSRTFMGEEAAGVDAVRIAQRRIEGGQGDIFLVGASYSALRPDFHQQYHAGGIMHVGPWRRLWDRPQAGMILGSAGAFLVLEARERAEKRGAAPRARLAAVASGRSDRAPGAAALLAQAQIEALAGRIATEGTLGVLSGACGIGAITREERDWLAALAGRRPLAVRGTAGALGHSMESAFLQNLVLAVASLERGSLFAPIDAEEPLEAAQAAPAMRQILVTSWGHNKGEGLGVVEKV